MNNPFNYPKDKHVRHFTPAPAKKYGDYKPFLRKEYAQKCVYCQFPDTIKGTDQFGADHYRPKSIFPELETEYSNLFYCCNTCNRRKGNKLPSNSSTLFIPNPDEHAMIEHLRFNEEIVAPVSKSGQYTCELLQLNHPDTVRLRRALLTSLAKLEQEKIVITKIEKAIQKSFNKKKITESERDVDLAEIIEQKYKNQEAIDVIAGRIEVIE